MHHSYAFKKVHVNEVGNLINCAIFLLSTL